MSSAACEMQEPPAALRYAKVALTVELAILIVAVTAALNGAGQAAQILKVIHWSLHLTACALIGVAASKMGRRWWRYAPGAMLVPFAGPLTSLHFLQRWRDTRP